MALIDLVALDIDGTLIAPGVPEDTLPGEDIVRAVQRLRDAGVIVVLATGRMFPGTLPVARHLSIDRPLICQQGASVHELDGSLRHAWTIEPEIALELVEFANQHGYSLAWFDARRYLVTAATPQAQYFADVSGVKMEIDPEPHKSGFPATGIDIVSSKEDAQDVHRLLEARYGARITLLDFTSVTAVHAPQASKGYALDMLCRELGIERRNVLAIGDSVNDVSMLSWAGHSAAPAHCDRYARDSAGKIVPGEGVQGVVDTLNAVLDG